MFTASSKLNVRIEKINMDRYKRNVYVFRRLTWIDVNVMCMYLED